jgi:hypothetical protein
MPPRSNVAVRLPTDARVPQFDFAGRRLRVVQPTTVAVRSPLPEEPSPMLEAIRRYLDSLP